MLLNRSWENFVENPIFGIGIGSPSDRSLSIFATTIAGIPISVPTEKGFLGFALLEEVGVIGTVIFSILIAYQIRFLRNSSTISYVILYLTALLVNTAESVYFSLGGIGILVHVAISTALISIEREIQT